MTQEEYARVSSHSRNLSDGEAEVTEEMDGEEDVCPLAGKWLQEMMRGEAGPKLACPFLKGRTDPGSELRKVSMPLAHKGLEQVELLLPVTFKLVQSAAAWGGHPEAPVTWAPSKSTTPTLKERHWGCHVADRVGWGRPAPGLTRGLRGQKGIGRGWRALRETFQKPLERDLEVSSGSAPCGQGPRLTQSGTVAAHLCQGCEQVSQLCLLPTQHKCACPCPMGGRVVSDFLGLMKYKRKALRASADAPVPFFPLTTPGGCSVGLCPRREMVRGIVPQWECSGRTKSTLAAFGHWVLELWPVTHLLLKHNAAYPD